MDKIPASEAALARWLAGGATSQSHPVLRFALATFLHPLGIEAAYLEAEPFSALESGLGAWWLREPAWNRFRFDPAHPAAPDFRPLIDRAGGLAVSVDDHGVLTPALEDRESAWRAARHTLHAAHGAEAFIYAAAGLILADEAAAAAYASGDHRSFCATVLGRLREAGGDKWECGGA